jgi:ribosomal protein S24E
MEIQTDARNELFKRQELTLTLQSGTTPNFNETKKQLAEQTKKPEENIDVHNIKSGFGNKTFTIHANIYDSKEDLDKIKQIQSTSKARKEAKKAEAEPESAKEETSTEEPATETKEETPAEEATETPSEEKPEEPTTENKEDTSDTKTESPSEESKESPTNPEENKE